MLKIDTDTGLKFAKTAFTESIGVFLIKSNVYFLSNSL